MLVRLFGSNFRSLKGRFELSLVSAELTRKEDRDRGVISVPLVGLDEPLRLLRVAAIYGANASGKSTVLSAARALHWLVTNSSAASKPGAPIPPYEPFLLDEASRTAAVELGCEVILKKSLLRYEIEFSRSEIIRETLSSPDAEEGKKLIERLPSGEVRGELIAGSEVNRLYVQEIQPNVAVLSKLAQHGPRRGADSVLPHYEAIGSATRCEDYSSSADDQILRLGADDRFATDSGYREWIMRHLMRAADFGICGVDTRRERIGIPDEIKEFVQRSSGGFEIPDERTIVSFVHEGAENQPIDFANESSGTRKLFNIADDWWKLANEPTTLFADELSASLHPRLLDRLIRAVNEPASSRARSQLIFATHDTGLLEGQDGLPPALRRDQVYFTKKDINGATDLYSLAEFKDEARPVHNLRKRYLSGLYGAIPSVEKLSL